VTEDTNPVDRVPQIGDRWSVDRPDWVAAGEVVAVEPHRAIAGHDGTGVVWRTDPTRYEVTVWLDQCSAGEPREYRTTVRVTDPDRAVEVLETTGSVRRVRLADGRVIGVEARYAAELADRLADGGDPVPVTFETWQVL